MPRRDERQLDLRTGAFVVPVALVALTGLFFVAQSDPWREDGVVVHADFESVAGLTKNHQVFLDGKQVGRVEDLEFVAPTYPCNPTTEDLGRFPARTDDCDPSLFCMSHGSAANTCGDLTAYTGDDRDYLDRPCTTDDDCTPDTVCISDDFRHRYPFMTWPGPRFTCVPMETRVHRIRVAMRIDASSLQFVRADSRATVGSSGLGEKLVDITVGTGTPVAAGGRIQSAPSLTEELALLEERFSSITNEVDRSLSGFDEVFDQVRGRDHAAIDPNSIRREISEIEVLLADISRGEGELGPYFVDPALQEDFRQDLADFRAAAADLDRRVEGFERSAVPRIRTIRRASGEIIAFVDGLRNPDEHGLISRLIADPVMGDELAERIASVSRAIGGGAPRILQVRAQVAELRREMSAGKGPLGIVENPKTYDELVKLFDQLERSESLRALARIVIAEEDVVVVVDVDPDPAPP